MRRLPLSLALILIATACTPQQATVPAAAFSVVETPIADMRSAMEQGRLSSRALVEQYLMRIAMYEDRINAI